MLNPTDTPAQSEFTCGPSHLPLHYVYILMGLNCWLPLLYIYIPFLFLSKSLSFCLPHPSLSLFLYTSHLFQLSLALSIHLSPPPPLSLSSLCLSLYFLSLSLSFSHKHTYPHKHAISVFLTHTFCTHTSETHTPISPKCTPKGRYNTVHIYCSHWVIIVSCIWTVCHLINHFQPTAAWRDGPVHLPQSTFELMLLTNADGEPCGEDVDVI